MKRIIKLFFAVVCMAILPTGCTKSPIILEEARGQALDDYFQARKAEIGKKLLTDTDVVLVDNKNTLDCLGLPYQWPEIDYDKYTLVFGRYEAPGTYKIDRIEILPSKLKVYIYDEPFIAMCSVENGDSGPGYSYFCGLFRKLPGRKTIEIVHEGIRYH